MTSGLVRSSSRVKRVSLSRAPLQILCSHLASSTSSLQGLLFPLPNLLLHVAVYCSTQHGPCQMWMEVSTMFGKCTEPPLNHVGFQGVPLYSLMESIRTSGFYTTKFHWSLRREPRCRRERTVRQRSICPDMPYVGDVALLSPPGLSSSLARADGAEFCLCLSCYAQLPIAQPCGFYPCFPVQLSAKFELFLLLRYCSGG